MSAQLTKVIGALSIQRDAERGWRERRRLTRLIRDLCSVAVALGAAEAES